MYSQQCGYLNKPSKILFFKEHINNLIKSSKAYSIFKKSLKALDILSLIKMIILNSKTKYNHLLRIAVNKNTLINFTKKTY